MHPNNTIHGALQRFSCPFCRLRFWENSALMFSMTSGLLAQNSLNGWAIQVLLSHSILSRIEKKGSYLFSFWSNINQGIGSVLILYSFHGIAYSPSAQRALFFKARQKIEVLICTSCAGI